MSDETGATGLAVLREQSGVQQGEFPFAIVLGEVVTDLPKDLYIPPEALEVFLQAFEGPLDLLLYLIKKQNLDILEINVFEITRQYIQYVEVIQELQLDVAGDYLVMAATLAEIKSRMLLPRRDEAEDEEEDPRAELIRRLQEYEQFKQAAERLDELPREGREFFGSGLASPVRGSLPVRPDVSLEELLLAMKHVMRREQMFTRHHVVQETRSTRETMVEMIRLLMQSSGLTLQHFVRPGEGRGGVVVRFLALMELSKERLVDIVQAEAWGPVHIRADADPAHMEARVRELENSDDRELIE